MQNKTLSTRPNDPQKSKEGIDLEKNMKIYVNLNHISVKKEFGNKKSKN